MMQMPEKISKKEKMRQVEAEALIIQQFRLFACMMRASIRKQSMHIGKAAKSVTNGLADDIQCPLVQSVICLIAETLEAILSLRRVSFLLHARATTTQMQKTKTMEADVCTTLTSSFSSLMLHVNATSDTCLQNAPANSEWECSLLLRLSQGRHGQAAKSGLI